MGIVSLARGTYLNGVVVPCRALSLRRYEFGYLAKHDRADGIISTMLDALSLGLEHSSSTEERSGCQAARP